jgi:hypothetical protein
MGYALMFGTCCSCRRIISFNPHKVPSLLINGTRQPICRQCAERWNVLHPEIAKPIQDGAYEEFDESEL